MEQIPLFERLGGRDGVIRLADKVVANHFVNPVIAARYVNSSMDQDVLRSRAAEFFCTGLSGVPTYEGKPLAEAHAGMNVSEEEFVAVIDDMVAAMDSEGIGEVEQGEVLRILWSMKPEVVRI